MRLLIQFNITPQILVVIIVAIFLPVAVNAESTECAHLKTSIRSSIEGANHCKVDSECTTKWLPCPFGCSVLLNKAELSDIEAKIAGYVRDCEDCEYKCIAVYGVPKCKDGKCLRVEG